MLFLSPRSIVENNSKLNGKPNSFLRSITKSRTKVGVEPALFGSQKDSVCPRELSEKFDLNDLAANLNLILRCSDTSRSLDSFGAQELSVLFDRYGWDEHRQTKSERRDE